MHSLSQGVRKERQVRLSGAGMGKEGPRELGRELHCLLLFPTYVSAPSSVSPRPPRPLSAHSAPGALSSASSSLEHGFPPFRHQLWASLSTRSRRLLLSFSGSQTPLVLFPTTLILPRSHIPAMLATFPMIPSLLPLPHLSLPVQTSLLTHPQLRPSILHAGGRSFSSPALLSDHASPDLLRECLLTLPTAPRPSEQLLLPLSVQAEEAGEIPGF